MNWEGGDYISKPVQVEEVVARINTHLTIRNLQKRLEEQNVRLRQEIGERRRAEKALEKERDFINTLVQSSPAFFVAIGADLKTIMMNGAMLSALGYTAEEVKGKDYLTTFVPEDDHGILSGIFSRIITERKPAINENHLLTRDGRRLLVEWRGRPIFNEEGEFDYFFGVGIDITGSRQLEQERERLISELQDALAGITVLKGLLPICAKCKKIRNDRGYWEKIETYIESHTEALFTHGLCGECADKIYGEQEWYKKRKQEGDSA